MNNVLNRMAALAMWAKHEETAMAPTLIVTHRQGNFHTGNGPWVAAICEFGTHMPLLCNDGEASLAAAGETPMEAMRNLDTKLWRLP